MKERAKAIAKEENGDDGPKNLINVVEFMIDREKYAIPSIYIKEICPAKEITPLPCTPDFMAGLINMRRHIVSVIDLKAFFGFPKKISYKDKNIIILEANKIEAGIIADTILQARTIFENKINISPSPLKGIKTEYIKSVIEGLLIVLDIEKILSDEKIIINEEV